MENWTNFYGAEVGGAAALAGLLVVAISINLTRIMSFPLLPGLAAQTVLTISGALVVASLALVPGQPLPLFGAEALTEGLLVAIAGSRQFGTVRLHRKEGDPLTWTLLPLLLVTITALPPIIGGLLLIAGSLSGLYWIAAGIICSFVATIEMGWVLMIEILR